MATHEREITIRNRLGLHARAAAQFVKTAGDFGCKVIVHKDGIEADGKSIMGIMMLAAPQGSLIRIVCDGDDAKTCLDALDELITNRFGEDD